MQFPGSWFSAVALHRTAPSIPSWRRPILTTHEISFLIFSYLLGSIPFGYILCRFSAHADIRDEGSGNIGASNVLRTLGPLGGFFTLLLDFLKGFLPVYYGTQHFDSPILLIAAGSAAVLGHIFSIFLGFRGGKGVATFFGVSVAFYPFSALIFLAGFFAAFIRTRTVSAGSLTGVTLVFFTHLLTRVPQISIVVLILTLIIILRHRHNILALIDGTERKISLRKVIHG